jgi:hypothetical protein
VGMLNSTTTSALDWAIACAWAPMSVLPGW